MNTHHASTPVSNLPEILAEVDRARRFLRQIRDGIAAHPLAGRSSRILLQERRAGGVSILRLSGTLDGLLVDLQVDVADDAPFEPKLQYSSSLDRLRGAQVLGVGASAFTVAHDRAWAEHYGAPAAEVRLKDLLDHAAARGRSLH